jgi:plastocyanin
MTNRRTFLAFLGGAGALVGAGCSGSKATAARQQTTTREILLTMWGMKPYAVPQGETAPSITADDKWTDLPIGPEGATYATVHHFVPQTITANKGDTIKLTVMNLGLHHHGFAIPDFGIDFLSGGAKIVGERRDLAKGKLRGTATGGPDARTVTFVADKAGVFTFMCNLPFNKEQNDCNPLHEKITGQLLVLA